MSEPASMRVTNDAETSIELLKERVRLFCEAREWDPFHGAKDLAIGVITEAAELLEHFRFRSEDEVNALFEQADPRAEIEAEVADVLIFVLRLAQKYEIDLSEAVHAKLARNEERYPVESSRRSNQRLGGREALRLYSGPSIHFIRDTAHNQIAEKLKSAFFQHYRFEPSPGEVQSWRNSLRATAQVFEEAGLKDHGVIL